ncbi:MAG: DNA-methyltransferase [Hyphomicrobiaceae bacterium]
MKQDGGPAFDGRQAKEPGPSEAMKAARSERKRHTSTAESIVSAPHGIVHGDGIKGVRGLPDACVHMIASDIPYGISADDWDVLHDNTNSALRGSSPAQSKAGAVFKSRGKPINGWSEADRRIPHQYYDWCTNWAGDWYRVLKPGSSVFVFAGRRYAHRCICALEDAGFSFKDMLAWMRDRAPHRAQRVSVVYERRGDVQAAARWEGWRVGNLRPRFEPVLWFTKPYRIGTTIADNALKHGVGPYNEAALLRYVSRPDNVLDIGFAPHETGLHPTQKPVRLMQALVEIATQPGQLVLDPFAGSGTTLLAAQASGRKYLGFEMQKDYAETARLRLIACQSRNAGGGL